MYRQWGKRGLDLTITLTAALALLPVFLVVALLVRIYLGRGIFFKQLRPGLDEHPFPIYKFRTMTDTRDAEGRLLPDAERLTAFGRFLRSTSLDELPGLINVIRGDMSLVGPRPLLMRYLPLYNDDQRRRHAVRPGITGWAQVNGRNAISWDEKFNLDLYYVEHCSLRLDLKILWLTAIKVFRREGISADGHATMPTFTGSRSTAQD